MEHYGRCPIVVGFARRLLRIQPRVWNLSFITTLGLAEGNCTPEELTIRAIWVYAVYKAHNLLRYKPLGPDESPSDLLLQFAKEGAFGHASAMQMLDGVWVRGSTRSRGFSNFHVGGDDLLDSEDGDDYWE